MQTHSYELQAAANAFGDGNHPTTQLALAAMQGIDPGLFTPAHACDIGCGSGILSFAMIHRFHCAVVAGDIARASVDMTQANALRNGVTLRALGAPLESGTLRVLQSDGFAHPEIKHHAPYPLIVINILAEVILAMTADAEAALAPGGVLILSGILIWQEMQVVAAYESVGLERSARLQHGDWVAHIWQKP